MDESRSIDLERTGEPSAAGTATLHEPAPEPAPAPFVSIDATRDALAGRSYLADPGLATSLYLALALGRPLFLEGEPGVGKTELAKVAAACLGTRLVRLQCYEGLDREQALYEWNYPKQLLALQARREAADGAGEADVEELYAEEYLLERPLLAALRSAGERAPVLLVDEIDRADEEFESFLLELLSDFQITIPEMGTVAARHRPVVFLTSNRTREIHDALKRRCIYHWIDYPDLETELAIVHRKVPALAEQLGRRVVAFVQALRGEELVKHPGVAETLDWAGALAHLGSRELDAGVVRRTLGLLVKYQEDVERLRGPRLEHLLAESAAV